jgi:hypothetical protein
VAHILIHSICLLKRAITDQDVILKWRIKNAYLQCTLECKMYNQIQKYLYDIYSRLMESDVLYRCKHMHGVLPFSCSVFFSGLELPFACKNKPITIRRGGKNDLDINVYSHWKNVNKSKNEEKLG